MFLEVIEVYSKRNLKSIWEEALHCFSAKEITFHQSSDSQRSSISVCSDMKFKFWYFLSTRIYTMFICEKLRESLYDYKEDFTHEEITQMYQSCLKKAEYLKTDMIQLIFVNLRKMEYITKSLNLDGFFSFGLSEFDREVDRIVDTVVDEFLAAEEYKEFIFLLKEYMHIQTPQIDKFIICITPDGKYRFYDETYTDITHECNQLSEKIFDATCTEEEDKQNDIVMSLLLILVPKKIYIYQGQYMKNKNFLITLKAIFDDRIELKPRFSDVF